MSDRLSPERLVDLQATARQGEWIYADALEVLAHVDAQQAELDRRTALVEALREALEEVRRHVPYPRDWPGQKVTSMAWSMPPSTEKALRGLVGDPTRRSLLLADAEAATW